MVDIAKLKAEIDGDPLERGYSAMSHEAAAANLNDDSTAELKRTVPKPSLSGDELFTATDSPEFAALTDEKRQMWVSWCNTDRDPHDAANVAFVAFIFGSGVTVANLNGRRNNTVSRAVELGLGTVKPGHVQNARM